MRSLILSQILHRPGRTFALAGGVLVSSVAFVLLTASARSSELRVQGNVKSAFRPAYDVLVRPSGSETALESSEGLVRDNYLSGIFGGITLRQWRRIERLPGVAVAAPIANVGYIDAFASVPVSVEPYLTKDPVQLFRVRTSYVTPAGSRYPGQIHYVYVTRNGKFVDNPNNGGQIAGQIDRGKVVSVCSGFTPPAPRAGQAPFGEGFSGPFALELFPDLVCVSTRRGRVDVLGAAYSRYAGLHRVAAEVEGNIPVLVAAVDPVQEAKLLHLDRAIVSGRYLHPSEQPTLRYQINSFTHAREGTRFIPVIAATKTFVGERLVVRVDRLRIPHGVDVPRALATGSCLIAYSPCPTQDVVKPPPGAAFRDSLDFVRGLQTTQVGTQLIPFGSIYRKLLIGTRDFKDSFTPAQYWGVAAARYRRRPDGSLVPRTVSNPVSAYSSESNLSGVAQLPLDNEDLQFRRLSERVGSNVFGADGVLATPTLRIVGRYDVSRLGGFSPLSRVPLETYVPPLLQPADRASAKAMHDEPLAPTQNLGDYIQQPPLLLTTIGSLPALFRQEDYQGVPASERQAPISAIRVRVAGVTGADSRSIARIDSVALRIHELTGLQVDVTAGSSPHPLTVALPAGKFGRPELRLIEGWSKKGVSLSFLHGIDRKQLALFALIPLLCCLFLGNGVFAATRARRTEIGALLTLGWPRSAIFRMLLGEVLLVGLLAGLVGVGVAAALVSALSLKASESVVLLVLPTSLLLVLVAGFVPAWQASMGEPLDALRPAVTGGRRGPSVRRLTGLALVNLRRVPGRSLVGGLGLVVGACALTVLIAVEQAFNGVLAGTVLGDAISVQIRGFDYLAIGLVIGLAALSIADVLYLNLRERQAELVTLRTLGWEQRHLCQVVLVEALVLGVAGALIGATIGTVVSTTALAAPLLPVLEGAAAAVSGCVIAAIAASLLPLSQLGRLTPPSVLAAEQ